MNEIICQFVTIFYRIISLVTKRRVCEICVFKWDGVLLFTVSQNTLRSMNVNKIFRFTFVYAYNKVVKCRGGVYSGNLTPSEKENFFPSFTSKLLSSASYGQNYHYYCKLCKSPLPVPPIAKALH